MQQNFGLILCSLAFFFLFPVILVVHPCPVGEAYFDSCFDISDSTMSVDNATAVCANITDNQGQLVYVRNADELEFLYWELENYGINKWETIHTGMKYEFSGALESYVVTYGIDGEYVDEDSSLWPEGGPWAFGYPSASQHECVGLVYDKTAYRWRFADVECTSNNTYICGVNLGKLEKITQLESCVHSITD